jgi:hypothetical protein
MINQLTSTVKVTQTETEVPLQLLMFESQEFVICVHGWSQDQALRELTIHLTSRSYHNRVSQTDQPTICASRARYHGADASHVLGIITPDFH